MTEEGRGDRESGDALDWYEEWDGKLAEQGFEPGADGESWVRRLNLALIWEEEFEAFAVELKRELIIELRQRIETVGSFRDLRQALDEWLRPGLADREQEEVIELPETLEKRRVWARVYYGAIIPKRREYQSLWKAGDVDSPRVKDEDIRDVLKDAGLGPVYVVRTIRKIRKAGDAGVLEPYR